jgi:hypothetical protein
MKEQPKEWKKLVKELCVDTFIMDDDSSCCAILQHGVEALHSARRISEEEAAKTKPTDNKGILPLEHPPINFKGNKNHWIRNYAKKLFSWAHANTSISKCQSGNAERLKRNFSYLLHQRGKIGKVFVVISMTQKPASYIILMTIVFVGSGALSDVYKKWRDKEMHHHIKPHHEAFTSKKALLEVWHKYHSNKCEWLNNMITKFVP